MTEGQLQVECIRSASRLSEIAPEWQELWDQCQDATPFQTPDWNLQWLEHLGHGQLQSYAIWRGPLLVGLVPLFLYEDRDAGLRRALFLGTSTSDKLDFLALKQHGPEVLDAFWRELCLADNWDVLDLQDLPCESPLVAHHLVLGQEPAREHDICRVVTLPADPIEGLKALPHGLRRNLRRYQEKLQGSHQARYELANEGTQDEFADAFVRLHTEQWQARGGSGMLSEIKVQRFHSGVQRSFQAKGLLRLAGLRVDGEIAAVIYYFASKRRAYAYLSGYSPQLAKYSIGSLVLQFAMESAIEEGLEAWDFLRGREPYKSVWGALDVSTYRVCIPRPKA